MLALTLAQMRRSAGRLAAAGIAIALGAAFVTATLLGGNAITRTTYNAVSSQYADADLVVGTSGTPLTEADLSAIRTVAGVEGVQGISYTSTDLSGPGGRSWVRVAGRADDPRLEPAAVLRGHLPDVLGEVALPTTLADQLGVDVGGTVASTRHVWGVPAGTEPPVDAQPAVVVDHLTVVGLLDTPSAFLDTGGTAVIAASTADAWNAADAGGDAQWVEAMVALTPGTAVAPAIIAVKRALGPDATVLTHDQRAAESAAQLTGSTDALTGVVLAFAAVSLLVASLVIANTFQVLIAQRTRTLALLRCVGADRRQLRRSVLAEASIVGLVASASGVLLGIGLVQAALTVLGRTTDVPLPSTVSITMAVVLVPLAVGTAVTLLASLAPARAATRVSPLAALRPVDPSVRDRAGRVRAVLSALLVVGGAALLALGTALSTRTDVLVGLGVGMLGGAISFFGVVLGAVFWVPGLLARGGRLLARGVAGRLAAANAVRNPRRVATTSGALFIGVTLVVMMSTGAASATRAFTAGLAENFPVDVIVAGAWQGQAPPPLPSGLAGQVADVTGVTDVTTTTATEVTVTSPARVMTTEVLGVDPDAARRVLLDPSQVDRLADDTILVSTSTLKGWNVAPGSTVTVTGPGGSLELTPVASKLPEPAVTATAMRTLDPSVGPTQVWARLTGLDAADTSVAAIQKLVDTQGQAIQVVGAAVQRAFFQRVIDTLLAVVVGLLGVAVVIALVGVANTLSLSVIERRRESATLRAIGLTRGQLRGTLAVEGLLVAGVGTAVGAVLGVLYGWIGAAILLTQQGSVSLVVPWGDLGMVLVVALAAGLLASVLPARSAARTPPVTALATE
jgi:putative ABC transport system permease protein